MTDYLDYCNQTREMGNEPLSMEEFDKLWKEFMKYDGKSTNELFEILGKMVVENES